ncbi:unknown [Prevotella sp. CAG:604]|nr:unknown [Prevotella sp. CAG:604]
MGGIGTIDFRIFHDDVNNCLMSCIPPLFTKIPLFY